MAPSATADEESPHPELLASLTAKYDDCLRFFLNGTRVTLDDIDPEITVLEWLRGIGLTGTKLGCGEGGCGACTIVVSQYNPTTKKIYHASINACLAPLVSLDGKHVITVEGIGSSKRPHAIQERFAKGDCSQCGFCTPGFIASAYALLRNNEAPTDEDIEEAFDGNLCRCTGYFSIGETTRTFSVDRVCGKGADCCKVNGSNGSGGDQPVKRFTPPGFIEYNPETELIFPPALKKHQMRPLAFGNKRKTWYRPVTLDQLLLIKKVYPQAKIIGGSTETHIETRFKAISYPVSVYVGDIAELRQYSFNQNCLEIGGNVVLTDLERICEMAIEKYGPQRSQVFKAMLKQLKLFAGRQIRNVGSPAGNLNTASPISDLNPVLWAANSIIVAKSATQETEIPMSRFFTGYRKTALPQDSIIASIRIPITAERGEYIRAYKQSKRKDDDIAIVTGALQVKLSDEGIVLASNFIYGGMAATTVAAKKAMEYIVGKRFSELETLEGTMSALGHDFDLTFSVPGGMASYRKALAFGFFYRFYHDVLESIAGQSDHFDGQAIKEVERQISSGQVDSTAANAYKLEVTGQSKTHLAALKQTTGEAQYTDDIPALKNELHACYVLSSRPHAKILSIDYTDALDMPGVVDYVDKDDMPSKEANKFGPPNFDEVFFADGVVNTTGQPIALILATTANRAREAARAVKVEYEDLPAILTMEEAIEQESFHSVYREIKNGDTEQGFKDSDHIFTGSVRMGGQEHFYFETNASLVVPKPEDGEMEIFASTQNANETQVFAARVCDVHANKINVRVKRLGGGFGGKETRSILLSSALALAGKKTGRPVRYMLTREEDMMLMGQRHPFLAKYKVGVNKDGKIQALECNIYNNAGHTIDLSHAVCERAMTHSDGCYKIPNVLLRGRLCKTNTMSNTAFRGFGGPQGMFIAETWMEEVADRLGMPVERLREINFYKDDESTHFNQKLTDWFVPLMYQQVQDESQYNQRREAIAKFNESNKWRQRGLALIPTKFGISFTALFLNQAGALVHIYHDGSILVAHGGTEMGQGLHTKMVQVAAQALRVPIETVHISETATNTVANASSTAASASSDLNGYAIYNACKQLNERLAPYREKLGPEATMKELAHAAYFDRVNLSAQGFYKTPEIGYDWDKNEGKMFFYFTQGVAAAEVEIDLLTGTWTCLRADIKMDVGQSINPTIDYGQIQGAFVQGMGLFTMEESLWLRNGPMAGNLFTRGPGAYKIPGYRDIPQVFNVSLLKDVEWKELRTIQRSRGIGEPPLFMGSAVFFAIRDALRAARSANGITAKVGDSEDAGDTLRAFSGYCVQKISKLPLTSLRVLQQISQRYCSAHARARNPEKMTDREVLPDNVKPIHYSLSLRDLEFKNWTYQGTVGIDVEITKPTKEIVLNTLELKLHNAKVKVDHTKSEQTIETTNFSYNEKAQRATIVFDQELPVSKKASLTITFEGIINNELAGFYRSKYKPTETPAKSVPRDDEWHYMFSTQFESSDARRAFPCFDEPGLKATFDFEVEVPVDQVALSNMPVKETKPTKEGWQLVTFETSPLMSSYLLAWAIGDFEYIETFTERKYNGKQLPVRVYTTRGLKEQGQWALEHAAPCIDYFSKIFDIDYPLPKADLLAVHEFTHGAMENWGLVTYRTTQVLFNEKTSDPRFKNSVAYVVAHELAHQWFGNLVTMSWWDELWLNESFATYAGWQFIDVMHPEWEVWAQFVNEGMETAFRLDGIRASHSIHVEVRDALDVNQIFDSISYLKGCSVLRMLVNHLGFETFVKGVSKYLKANVYGNATTKDLWDALSEVSGQDINKLMAPWIAKIGHPVLNVGEEPGQITIKQSRFLSTGDVKPEEDTTTWWVPLGLEGKKDESGVAALSLEKKEETITGINDDFYKLNSGATGFFRVNYPASRLAKLSTQLGRLSSEDKIAIIGSTADLAFAGNGNTAALLTFLQGFSNESHSLVWSQVLDSVGSVKSVFGEDEDLKKGLSNFVVKLIDAKVKEIGWEAREGEDYLVGILRKSLISSAVASGHPEVTAEALKRFDAWVENPEANPIPPSLRTSVWRAGLDKDPARAVPILKKEWFETKSIDGKLLCLVLGLTKDVELLKSSVIPFNYNTSPPSDAVPNADMHALAASLARNSSARNLHWDFLKNHWDAIVSKIGNPIVVDRLVKVSLKSFTDESFVDDIAKFFADKDTTAFNRSLGTVQDSIRGRAAYKKRDSAALKEWLGANNYI
ncbi:unnamed protein product [Clonostachys rosea f. rosea IK726]|uniref:Uncharacterized protein n=1 Tax=Clonostachys rosea f. rosea IK726 TaxID=1349383 RepID=A0ACA9TDS4_BIOOC|nr:unnamed protein product [Clonostachys rosea f. rosea IK726]